MGKNLNLKSKFLRLRILKFGMVLGFGYRRRQVRFCDLERPLFFRSEGCWRLNFWLWGAAADFDFGLKGGGGWILSVLGAAAGFFCRSGAGRRPSPGVGPCKRELLLILSIYMPPPRSAVYENYEKLSPLWWSRPWSWSKTWFLLHLMDNERWRWMDRMKGMEMAGWNGWNGMGKDESGSGTKIEEEAEEEGGRELNNGMEWNGLEGSEWNGMECT